MSTPAKDPSLNSELDSFRQQWISDLRTRNESESQPASAAARPAVRHHHPHHGPPPPSSPTTSKKTVHVDDEDELVESQSFDGPAPEAAAQEDGGEELVSALDHYEEAMEKEAQGNMGDSLSLYRKAYRLDNRVDRRYREKHFPASSRPAAAAPRQVVSNATPAPAAAPMSAPGPAPAQAALQLSIGDLIASFANLKMEPAPPEMEGMPAPPCPLARLPNELVVHVMRDVAVNDVGDFVRLSQVCKHFAYLVATEQRIWRRVCMGDEVGFGAMHHHWQTRIEWDALDDSEMEMEDEDGDDDEGEGVVVISPRERAARRRRQKTEATLALHPAPYSTWKAMFRQRPRLRFNGCYISTVNYVRTGQASTNQTTWNSPIHIVTYYRYLRFYRDGTCVSLLTTAPPPDVVHHLARDLLELHRDGSQAHLPSAVMAYALRGRWRLSPAGAPADADAEGDLVVETEGVGPKYTYRMDLSLRSAAKSARNNKKLTWRGFWSYNKLTDDWAEFTLKNDKPFFFSRVKSYRVGDI